MRRRVSYLNDEIFKKFIDLQDEDSIFFTKQIIYLATGLKVDSIERIDRELDREFEGTKRNHVDFLAKANGQMIHIEIQKYIAHPALLPRILLYQSRIYSSQKLKGMNPQDYNKVITILFYEDIYHDDDQFVSRYEYMNALRGRDEYNRLEMYMIELGKINMIYQTKGIEKMSKLEKICFAIKNSDNESFSDILKVIEESEEEVKIMKDKFDLFEEGFWEDFVRMKDEVDLITKQNYFEEKGLKQGLEKGFKQGIEQGREIGIEQGIEQGREIGIQQGIERGIEQGIERGKEIGIQQGKEDEKLSTLKVLVETKYGKDASWLESLSYQEMEELTPYLLSDLTYEELKNKFYKE